MPCVGFALLLALPLAAADLTVEVTRNGFTAPLEIVLAPRVDGMLPKWSARKTIAAEQSAVTFPNLDDGLYLILAKGPQPLQRLSARINLGTAGSTLRLVLPATETAVQVTLAGKPLPRAGITFTHDELRWRMDVETDEHGRFAGPLWEPGRYSANVTRGHSAPHLVEHVTLSAAPLTIDVPDRHVTGRVLTGDGTPVADAQVHLRTETSTLKLNARTRSGPDGRFEFLGALEGLHTLTARAPSYLQSDAARFELHGAGGHSADLVLTRGEPRSVRVIDARDAAIAGATLFTSCDGHLKSQTVTNAEGRADIAVPPHASCAMVVVPSAGSIAIARVDEQKEQRIRVPDGSSSLRLALKSDIGQAFTDFALLMRIDGAVVPPDIARLLTKHGFKLTSDDEGSISLARIPPGTYEFWPYREQHEGQMIYEVSSEVAAPIAVKVVAGENDATVRLKARQ